MAIHHALVALAVVAPLVLCGCGWEPLYADLQTGPASEELRAIKVQPIPERIGQRLEIALRNSLNPTRRADDPALSTGNLYSASV